MICFCSQLLKREQYLTLFRKTFGNSSLGFFTVFYLYNIYGFSQDAILKCTHYTYVYQIHDSTVYRVLLDGMYLYQEVVLSQKVHITMGFEILVFGQCSSFHLFRFFQKFRKPFQVLHSISE